MSTTAPRNLNLDESLEDSITIGGKTYPVVPLTTKALRDLRKFGRLADAKRREIDRVAAKLAGLVAAEEPDEVAITAAEVEADALEDDLLGNTLETIQLQLGGAKAGPSLELLREKLDMRRAEAITKHLGGDTDEDPSTPSASTSS